MFAVYRLKRIDVTTPSLYQPACVWLQIDGCSDFIVERGFLVDLCFVRVVLTVNDFGLPYLDFMALAG
jgi:hypothetical protein